MTITKEKWIEEKAKRIGYLKKARESKLKNQ